MWPLIASPHTAANPYSQTEVLNRRFKRIAWSTSLLFLGVIVLLILELMGVIPISPLQPNIKVGVSSPPLAVPPPAGLPSASASDSANP
jgi:hypothetical protein